MNKDPSTGTSKLLLKFEIAKGVSGLNDKLGGLASGIFVTGGRSIRFRKNDIGD